jgi:hypothetical protein
MAGPVPAIYVLLSFSASKTWMAGTSPAMTTFHNNESVKEVQRFLRSRTTMSTRAIS